MQWFQKISKSEINQEGRMRSFDLSQTTINISKNDLIHKTNDDKYWVYEVIFQSHEGNTTS